MSETYIVFSFDMLPVQNNAYGASAFHIAQAKMVPDKGIPGRFIFYVLRQIFDLFYLFNL